jgi:hypothetical protein
LTSGFNHLGIARPAGPGGRPLTDVDHQAGKRLNFAKPVTHSAIIRRRKRVDRFHEPHRVKISDLILRMRSGEDADMFRISEALYWRRRPTAHHPINRLAYRPALWPHIQSVIVSGEAFAE